MIAKHNLLLSEVSSSIVLEQFFYIHAMVSFVQWHIIPLVWFGITYLIQILTNKR